jgi:hypothetical protein
MTDNLRHWNELCRTDPKHTKAFTRGGGFRGTAIKPIWTEFRMTEHFGPCGVGWGMDKPEHTVVAAGEELLVFCTVRLWYRDNSDVTILEDVREVYGVGGDKIRVQQAGGLRNNDEAFKASFTDALSNAMKHIGVAADVHMGLFDDNKYVRETGREFAREASPIPLSIAEKASKAMAHNPETGEILEKPKIDLTALTAAAWAAANNGTVSLQACWMGFSSEARKALGQTLLNDLKRHALDADMDLPVSEPQDALDEILER